MSAETALKNVAINPTLHAKLKAQSDRIGMKFRIYIENILRKAVEK
jgi:hypothetical protein